MKMGSIFLLVVILVPFLSSGMKEGDLITVAFPDHKTLIDELGADFTYFNNKSKLTQNLADRILFPRDIVTVVKTAIKSFCQDPQTGYVWAARIVKSEPALYRILLAQRSPAALKVLEDEGIYQPLKRN